MRHYSVWHAGGFLGLVILDQATKWLANTSLGYFDVVTVIPRFLSIQLVHNPGAAWGIFAHQRFFLVFVSMAVLAVLWFMRKRFGVGALGQWAVVCLAAGTLGNGIDRLTWGWVTDFINIGIIPVFNLADVLINIGVFGVLIDSFRRDNA